MKKRKTRLFTSIDEIIATYMPQYASSTESPVPDDPAEAGKLLAQQLMNAVRDDVRKTLRIK